MWTRVVTRIVKGERRGAVLVAILSVGLATAVIVQPWSAAGSRLPRVVSSVERPRVLRVQPDTIRGRGGVRMLVLGRGFTQGTVITVGGHSARVLAVRNRGAIVAFAPPGVGTEIVRAITGAGTSVANPRSRLHYVTHVLVVGDSLGIDLGWGFSPAVDARDGVTVTDDAVGSSGLVRADFYNWPEHLRADVAAVRADVVVTLFGTNDEQSFHTASGELLPGTAAWDRHYAARVRQVAAVVRAAGATLVWVSLPRMGPSSVLAPQFVSSLVGLDQRVVAGLHDALFVNAWALFTSPDGSYTPWVRLGPSTWALGHQPDDTHLTVAGAAAIVVRARDALARSLGPTRR